MRNDFLNDQLSRLLGRLSPPRAIAGNAEAQQAEISHMVRVIGANAPRQNLGEWWFDFEAQLLESLTTRAWPTVFEIKRACKDIRGGAQALPDETAEWLQVQGHVVEHGTPHPAMNTPWFTKRLIDAGNLPSLREARFRGFDLSSEQMQVALSQRPSEDEWRHHVRVMARIRGASEAETDAQEMREVSEGQRPDREAAQ